MPRSAASFLLVALMAATLLPGCRIAPSEGKVAFRLDVPEGRTMASRVEIASVTTVRMIGNFAFHLDAAADLRHVSAGRVDGLQMVDVTLEDIEVNYDLEQSVIVSDEDIGSPFDDEAFAERYRGSTVRMHFDEHARIEKITGLEEVIGQEAADSLAEAMSNAEKILGANFFDRLLAFLAVLPEEPVEPGDAWSHVLHQEILGLPVRLDADYIFRSHDRGVAIFDVDSRFRTDTARLRTEGFEFPFPELPVRVGQIDVLLRGTQKGEVQVDEKTGWTRSSDLTQHFEMEFRIGMASIPVLIDNTVSLRPR